MLKTRSILLVLPVRYRAKPYFFLIFIIYMGVLITETKNPKNKNLNHWEDRLDLGKEMKSLR